MSKPILYFLLLILFGSLAWTEKAVDHNSDLIINEIVHGVFEANSSELISHLEILQKQINSNDFTERSLSKIKSTFLDCRMLYKKQEFISSFYFPASDINLNGPVISEVEYEDEPKQMIVRPTGFQVIESYLWSDSVSLYSLELKKQVAHFIDVYSSLTRAIKSKKINERQLFEAIELELNRHFSLGIANFDTPSCNSSFEEIKTSMNTMSGVLNLIYPNSDNNEIKLIKEKFKLSINYLNQFKSQSECDLLICLRDHYIPLSISTSMYISGLPEDNYDQSTALRKDQQSIFDRRGFNAFFYNPRGENKNYSTEVADLGRILFFDPILSLNDKRACASCHRPNLAFTDKLPTSAGFHAGKTTSRNAPTILNVALQRNYFWDNRSTDLEDQVGQVILNSNEMMSSYELIMAKLNQSNEYKVLFRKAFQGTEDTLINKFSISNAIAEYERRLIVLNSKFDKNVRGEAHDYTAEEKLGFQVFMTKGNCASCHYLPMFSGLVPPNYTKSEFENIGTTKTADFTKPILDPDSGRGARYRTAIYVGGFKTPTLRNVALTSPYMHNGAFKTLEEVVEFYNEGGGAGLGLNVPNQTLSSDKLNLTTEEKSALIAFLFTLTDTSSVTDMPNRLPRFPGNSVFNTRVIGGEY